MVHLVSVWPDIPPSIRCPTLFLASMQCFIHSPQLACGFSVTQGDHREINRLVSDASDFTLNVEESRPLLSGGETEKSS